MLKILVLLLFLAQYFNNSEALHVTTCSANTCGQNAQCTASGGRPVCSCLKGHTGDPLKHCKRADCKIDPHCHGHMTCRQGHCVDACAGICGAKAKCEIKNHIAFCFCPAGYTGDPYISCNHKNHAATAA